MPKCHSEGAGAGVTNFKKGLLTFNIYPVLMSRERDQFRRVTLMLQDGEGAAWPLSLSADCMQFIGRYRRLRHFTAGDGLLSYAPGNLA